MDRTKPAFPKMQSGFIDYIVRPLLEAYWAWLRSFRPIAEPLLNANAEHWKRRMQESGGGDGATSPQAAAATPVGDDTPQRKCVDGAAQTGLTPLQAADKLGAADALAGAAGKRDRGEARVAAVPRHGGAAAALIPLLS